MISSTAKDLPEHRKQVIEACQRVGMFPLAMEHLPADPDDAAKVSVRMIEDADLYIGIFAYRYGYVPKDSDISVTEMEYNRAIERGIPCLIFFMQEEHPVKPRDVETGTGADRLARLKERIGTSRVAAFFKSPEDLRAHVIHALEALRKQMQKAKGGEPEPIRFHALSVIPKAPEPYIAHSYALLQTGKLIGRQTELTALTDWVTGQGELARVSLLAVVAIGGMGKSALTWYWFQTVAEQEWPTAQRGPLQGRLWWSFYESDAHFENFVCRALAYVLSRSEADVRKEVPSLYEQGEMLVRELDKRPILLVLDGLERILAAYAGANAAYLQDDERLDEETANRIGDLAGLPTGAGQTVIGRHPQRRTADPRAGQFLRRLASVRASRVLVSTRLFPSDLQTSAGSALPGSGAKFLMGLSETDALELWRAFGAKGSREQMLPVFDTFGRHPLLIQVLAGVVAEFREAPGDFDAWHQANPDFRVFGLPLVQVRSHVLEHALRGLSEAQRKVLHTVAGFRMPVGFATLRALFVGSDKGEEKPGERGPLFPSCSELDAALTLLEDRGLLGWDRRANRYDLHPIVRGVMWGGLDNNMKRRIYIMLHSYFESLPAIGLDQINCFDDLTPVIELYNALIGLERYDDAYPFLREHLEMATMNRLSVVHLHAQLAELLFPDGVEHLPRLSNPNFQADALRTLARGYRFSGRPRQATSLYRRSIALCAGENDQRLHSALLSNLAGTLELTVSFREAEAAARRGLQIAREHDYVDMEEANLANWGIVLTRRGAVDSAEVVLHRCLEYATALKDDNAIAVANSFLSLLSLFRGAALKARTLANRGWQVATESRDGRQSIHAATRQGDAALHLDDLNLAGERFQYVLSQSRAVNLVEQELPALVGLAEIKRRQRDLQAARELLEDAWDLAERGPYPGQHADALNALARIERDAGNREEAVTAATEAYRWAWGDGPPYAYHWGLEDARQLLAEFGAPEPQLPPFDPSRFPPMPEVEIDPHEEPRSGQ